MSKENYDATLAAMEVIPQVEVRIPGMPVNVYSQEAVDLNVWAQDDEAQLTKAGLDWNLVAELTVRAGALRYAQSLWMKERHTREDAQREWDERSPAAYELKNDLEAHCRYAFRMRPDLLAKVQAIEEGTGDEDMVQDLSDLAVLCKAHMPLLEAVGVDPASPQLAETTSTEMSQLLALVNGEKTDNSSAKLMRDRAYTYLKKAVDEVREAGKYVFRKDNERLKGYGSAYYRNGRG